MRLWTSGSWVVLHLAPTSELLGWKLRWLFTVFLCNSACWDSLFQAVLDHSLIRLCWNVVQFHPSRTNQVEYLLQWSPGSCHTRTISCRNHVSLKVFEGWRPPLCGGSWRLAIQLFIFWCCLCFVVLRVETQVSKDITGVSDSCRIRRMLK